MPEKFAEWLKQNALKKINMQELLEFVADEYRISISYNSMTKIIKMMNSRESVIFLPITAEKTNFDLYITLCEVIENL